MTTQMSFNPSAIAAWIGRMRASGVTLPVHIGLPGVADLTKLVTIAARIGVADSARYLKKNRNLIGQVVKGRFGPDGLLRELAPPSRIPRPTSQPSTSSRSTRSRAPLPGSAACLARSARVRDPARCNSHLV